MVLDGDLLVAVAVLALKQCSPGFVNFDEVAARGVTLCIYASEISKSAGG
jgi:hypothetical protein